MVWIGRHSDRHDERRWHVAGPALLAALGLVLSAFATSGRLRVTTSSPGCGVARLSVA